MKKEIIPLKPETDVTVPITPGPVHHERITNGPILFLLVALLLAILGGMYHWFIVLKKDVPTIVSTSLRPSAAENKEPESTTARAQTEAYGVVSTSDEVPAIEADVAGTNLDSLDSELSAIDNELDAAVKEDSKTGTTTTP